MKSHLISNILLSSCMYLFIFLLDNLLEHDFSTYYYLTISFFLIIYLFQAIMVRSLGQTPSGFNLIYNVTTMLKMLLSILFLVAYYLLLAEQLSNSEKITFSAFFIVTYFIYLIINTKMFFTNTNAKQ
mgnify:CR=1 FL=1